MEYPSAILRRKAYPTVSYQIKLCQQEIWNQQAGNLPARSFIDYLKGIL